MALLTLPPGTVYARLYLMLSPSLPFAGCLQRLCSRPSDRSPAPGSWFKFYSVRGASGLEAQRSEGVTRPNWCGNTTGCLAISFYLSS